MRYDIATLTIKLGSVGRVLPAIDTWSKAPDAKGTLFGCWASEIGDLNEITLFRAFADEAEMFAERWRTLATPQPFGCRDLLVDMRFDSYAPFPFLPPVTPGRYGEVYEIRTYRLKHGGVPATIKAWEAAVPARIRLSPLIMAMYALDGLPRFTHIWPYKSLNDRAAVRAETVAKGVWPPKGGPDWLTGDMKTVIAVPTAISQLV